MECSVTIQGLPLFQYVSPDAPPAGGDCRDTPCRAGVLCRAARLAGGCRLPAAVRPVIEAFSSVVSYEKVLLVLREGRERAVLEETGQRAALRLLLIAMRGSGCPFFEHVLPTGVEVAWGEDSYDAFRGMVRQMALGQPAGATAPRLAETSLARCGQDIEAHLAPILGEARRRCRRDAALNAVVLMYSCARLAVEESLEALMPRATAA